MSDIYQEIEREWVGHYQQMASEIPPITEFINICSALETEKRKQNSDAIQPWLAIFEFGIEWLRCTHIALSETERRESPRRHLATCALIGSAASFGLALRTLCLSGFDTPAEALLRTYVEALLLCLVLLHDEDLAEAYAAANDNEQAKSFWDKNASPRKLHARVLQIERKIGLTQEAIKEMARYRTETQLALSQSTHLSYMAALRASITQAFDEDDMFRDLATRNLRSTTIGAAFATFYFSCLASNFILGQDASKCLLVFDRESDWQRRMVVGRRVLSSITLRHTAVELITPRRPEDE